MEYFSNPVLILSFLVSLILTLVIGSWLRRRREKQQLAGPQIVLPIGEAIMPEELAKFESWLDAKSMPYVGLAPTGSSPISPTDSRLGGRAAMPAGADWPIDKTGKAMVMLAQINFAQIKGLPEFPDVGVLQYFIPSEDVFGLNFDDPMASDHTVLWHPDVSKLTAILAQPLSYKEDYSPFMNQSTMKQGIGLVPAKVAPQRPDWEVWFVGEGMQELYDRSGGEEAMEAIFEAMDYHAHRVGGHPSFTQQDPRENSDLRGYDRVLLQVGCDDDVMFGDSGECTFLITAADLKARRFDRVLYNWDCC